ncbi:hypothetical protein SLS58_005025 [Diplodia intermedia]|uniref:Heterokaryon incompatibility domain-containing protein n=1 Tax=Diplodia intermedia TaxID=856260 RepID=A0ABR3TRH5_9PEZI
MLSYRERAVKSLSHAHRTLQYLKHTRGFEYKGAVDDLIPATFCFLGCIGEALTNAMQFMNPELDDALHASLAWDFVLAFYPLSSPNYSVDVEKYVPKHSGILKEEDKCDCSYINPPFEDVVGASSRGSIPVIHLPTEDEAAASGERLAVSLSSDAPYIAISHAWVWKLAAFAPAMIPTGRFWLDTLCVPKQKDARQQTLKLMGRAHRDAECVVVRDQTVEACSPGRLQ